MEHPFIGIDESNHGRYPEVFVAVYSSNPADIQVGTAQLGKIRDKQPIEDILRGKTAYHVLVPQRWTQYGHQRTLRVIATSELILHSDAAQEVIIDGEMPSTHIEEIHRILHPRKVNVTLQQRADQFVPLVNSADSVANKLFRYYSGFSDIEDARDYSKIRICVDLGTYRQTLTRLS